MTYSVPTSPMSKSTPEPCTSGNIAGIGQQHSIWYDIEDKVEPLYNPFHHDQCYIPPLPMFPAKQHVDWSSADAVL